MRYQIRHVTEYAYNDRVSHSYNLAHIIPRDSSRQRRISNEVQIQPLAAYTATREDYFGNTSHHFEIQQPHEKLTIISRSQVDTNQQMVDVQPHVGLNCADARSMLNDNPSPESLLAREFMCESAWVKHTSAPRDFARLRDYAAPSFREREPLLACVMDLTHRIFSDFTYCPESTTVTTPLHEVLAKRRGVCQDFAHLQIACLRLMGFPAKYVSGYIETLPSPGKEKFVGADASHAWIAVYCPVQGWVEFDPTNDCLAAEQHIVTAWGRDYADVTPLRGVFFGGGENPQLNISVDVARVS